MNLAVTARAMLLWAIREGMAPSKLKRRVQQLGYRLRAPRCDLPLTPGRAFL